MLLNGLSDTERNGKSIQINQKEREREGRGGEGTGQDRTGQTDRQKGGIEIDREKERKRERELRLNINTDYPETLHYLLQRILLSFVRIKRIRIQSAYSSDKTFGFCAK